MRCGLKMNRRHVLQEEPTLQAFKSGNKQMAEQLLLRIPLPAVHTVTTTFKLPRYRSGRRPQDYYEIPPYKECSMVSLLHLAACWGWGNVVTRLVSVYNCAANSKDSVGQIPLHYAAYNGHLEVVKYFIAELQCDPMEKDDDGWTALHFACENGQLCTAQYLIREKHCNPSCETNDANSPLHFACLRNQAHIVQYLLSTGQVKPLAGNKYGHTPYYLAIFNYDTIKLFHQFEECETAFPVHTFTKLILTGDSGAGKTTIAKHIVHLASTANSDVPVDCVANVERYTAGIVPHHIQSEQLGNFVMYDFAGQQEYYSSHAAILEQVMRKSAAMFVCLIDLRKSNENICQSLHYWLSFIDNACSTAEERSHVLIVGSHADQVVSSVEEKRSLLQTIIANRRVRRQEYVECIAMDCRRANTNLMSILTNSQKAIAASQPFGHFYNPIVYAFLRTKLTVVGCTLHDLISAIAKENSSFLPNDQSVLVKVLTTLSDKGLILFIHNPHSSWVIVKTETLLNEISGTLFAPRQFKEHRDIIASNTGIVSTSSLLSVFPHHNTDMLVSFLQSLNFCRPVEPSVLENMNLQIAPSHSADLLFFPGLIQSERPDNLVQQGTLEFGWCLRCVDSNEFFSSRFLHVLLLSVAYKFPLSPSSSSVSGLHRMCTVWKNGIFWRNYDNITTVIELLDNNRWVFVAMSCDDSSPIEHAELRSSLVALVRHLQQQYCPHLNVREFLISPDLIQQYPLDNPPDSDLFDIHHVARSMLLHKKVVPSYEDGRGFLRVQSLPFEPYYQLSSSSVCQLLNPVMADQPVPAPLLHEVRILCRYSKMNSLVYKELKEYLDKLSLFVGRNPLVSSVAVL